MIKLQKKEMNLTFEYRIRQAQPLRFTLHIRCCQEEPKRGKPSHSGSNAMCSLLISILIKNRDKSHGWRRGFRTCEIGATSIHGVVLTQGY